jgi:hypothetical protein
LQIVIDKPTGSAGSLNVFCQWEVRYTGEQLAPPPGGGRRPKAAGGSEEIEGGTGFHVPAGSSSLLFDAHFEFQDTEVVAESHQDAEAQFKISAALSVLEVISLGGEVSGTNSGGSATTRKFVVRAASALKVALSEQ